MDFLEIKRHLNKPDEQYRCRLVRREPGHVILKYVSDRPFASEELGISFPPGCITIALYRQERPYVFWAIHSPAGERLGYLVHISKDMRISQNAVEYVDMLLDIWFFPDGRYIVLDEDEVDECLKAGRLDEAAVRYIETAKEAALREFPANVAESDTAPPLDISGSPQ